MESRQSFNLLRNFMLSSSENFDKISKLEVPKALSNPEPVFLNAYGARESIPRNDFRQPM
jgi:hypothetical protein